METHIRAVGRLNCKRTAYMFRRWSGKIINTQYNPPGLRINFLLECFTDLDAHLDALAQLCASDLYGTFGKRHIFRDTVMRDANLLCDCWNDVRSRYSSSSITDRIDRLAKRVLSTVEMLTALSNFAAAFVDLRWRVLGEIRSAIGRIRTWDDCKRLVFSIDVGLPPCISALLKFSCAISYYEQINELATEIRELRRSVLVRIKELRATGVPVKKSPPPELRVSKDLSSKQRAVLAPIEPNTVSKPRVVRGETAKSHVNSIPASLASDKENIFVSNSSSQPSKLASR